MNLLKTKKKVKAIKKENTKLKTKILKLSNLSCYQKTKNIKIKSKSKKAKVKAKVKAKAKLNYLKIQKTMIYYLLIMNNNVKLKYVKIYINI